MAKIPTTMRSLVAPTSCDPSKYEIATVPVPSITEPHDLLIKVHAAGIMTGDTLVASGKTDLLQGKRELPFKLGIECSGVVVAIGSAVAAFKPGDAVYGVAFGHPMKYQPAPGYCSEYCVGHESLLAAKPPHVSFEQAAGLLCFAVTAYQAIELGARHLAARGRRLEGATVFVPGALSATGHIGVQMLKNVYGVGRIVTTVSTPKVPLVEEHLPGLVDQVIDYTKVKNLADAVPPGSVDFAYNTQWSSLAASVPIMNRETGVVVSIASLFPYRILKSAMGADLPWWLWAAAGLAQLWYRWLLVGTGVKLDFLSANTNVRADFEKVAEYISLGKVKAILNVVELEDIEAVRKACSNVYNVKGGLGKLVVKIV
ncbi:alcohol dehydrogenase [Xylariales sp. PMI_506]|nr:alcohol dehydrogenase [Xylariales sp. PMI_506]